MTLRQREPRVRDEAHLRWLRGLPCCVCGNPIETESAHLRFSSAAIGKFNPGVGQKAHDKFAVPLCGKHHHEQHEAGNERAWWKSYGIDPLTLAANLFGATGDHARGCEIVGRARLSVMAAG